MIQRKLLAGVIGSGSESHVALSAPLGRWLAVNGYNLINGGGGGVMEAVARSFAEIEDRQGLVVAIVPSAGAYGTPVERKNYRTPDGYPNPYVEITIRTHLHLSGSEGKETASRNAIIILSADFVIALPGSHGTRSEIELALEFGKPLVLIEPKGEWAEFKQRAKRVKTVEQATGWIKNREF